MKTQLKIVILGLPLFLALSLSAAQDKAPEIPDAVKIELLRIEETFNVLDQVAAKVWPGWTDYKDYPFLLNFENGLRILVGHPSPPEGFIPVPNLKVAGKAVLADIRELEPLKLEQPLTGGGGIIPYGTFDGNPILTVDISLGRFKPTAEGSGDRFRTEEQMLMYLHELFHCFQNEHVQVPYPNFRYNPDTDFASYSEIEGAALENAYQAADPQEAKHCLADFLAARALKRKKMEESDQHAESGDEVREGTAVYSEVRTLEAIKQDFKPGLTVTQDPYYGGFQDIDSLLKRYQERLAKTKADTFNYLKCYEYGCYQALLLQRLFPGWQEAFAAGPAFLDEEIRKRIAIPDDASVPKRFENVYGFAAIQDRHRKAVEERDAAYRMITAREGRSYIISLKPIRQYLSSFEDKARKSWSVGLMQIFPDGIGPIAFDDVNFSGTAIPAETNQLFYVKIVDTDWKTRDKPYALTFDKKEGDDVYFNAVLTTPLFTLKASKIKIRESERRVKIWILGRVKAGNT